MIDLINDLRNSQELLRNLTLRDIRGKYKRTALGQLWSLVNPLASMLVYTAVFSVIMRIQPPVGNPSGLNSYAVFLLCALLPWGFFTNVVNGAMGSLIGNEDLVKKVFFPRITLVTASTLSWMFSWAIEMAILVVAIALFGDVVVFLWIPAAILAMIVFAAFSLGIGMMLAIANVFFRDTQHFVSILFQVWFYLTPIIYPVSMVENLSASHGPILGDITLLNIYQLNPIERFAAVFRSLLYDNAIPNVSDMTWCLAWAVVALALGTWIFRKNEKGLAEAL